MLPMSSQSRRPCGKWRNQGDCRGIGLDAREGGGSGEDRSDGSAGGVKDSPMQLEELVQPFRARNLNVKVTIQYGTHTIFMVDEEWRPIKVWEWKHSRGLRTGSCEQHPGKRLNLRRRLRRETKRTASETERNVVPATFQTFHKNSLKIHREKWQSCHDDKPKLSTVTVWRYGFQQALQTPSASRIQGCPSGSQTLHWATATRTPCSCEPLSAEKPVRSISNLVKRTRGSSQCSLRLRH